MSTTKTTGSSFSMPICGLPREPNASSGEAATTTRLSAGWSMMASMTTGKNWSSLTVCRW